MTQTELESVKMEFVVLFVFICWLIYSVGEKRSVAWDLLSHNPSMWGGIERIQQGCWWSEWILVLRNFKASLSASVGWTDPMWSQENPAPLSGPLWPIKDMERAYLKLQHTSPGQTNSLQTPSERPPGTDKYSSIRLRREWARESASEWVSQRVAERERGRERERKNEGGSWSSGFTERSRKKKNKKTYLPSNLCFKKSNSAFCIMSVT